MYLQSLSYLIGDNFKSCNVGKINQKNGLTSPYIYNSYHNQIFKMLFSNSSLISTEEYLLLRHNKIVRKNV